VGIPFLLPFPENGSSLLGQSFNGLIERNGSLMGMGKIFHEENWVASGTTSSVYQTRLIFLSSDPLGVQGNIEENDDEDGIVQNDEGDDTLSKPITVRETPFFQNLVMSNSTLSRLLSND
jgi:hypothetical protein